MSRAEMGCRKEEVVRCARRTAQGEAVGRFEREMRWSREGERADGGCR
jgi:hypothetical protein